MKFNTLVDLLRDRSLQQPDTQTYTYLHEGETEALSLTYAILEQQ